MSLKCQSSLCVITYLLRLSSCKLLKHLTITENMISEWNHHFQENGSQKLWNHSSKLWATTSKILWMVLRFCWIGQIYITLTFCPVLRSHSLSALFNSKFLCHLNVLKILFEGFKVVRMPPLEMMSSDRIQKYRASCQAVKLFLYLGRANMSHKSSSRIIKILIQSLDHYRTQSC